MDSQVQLSIPGTSQCHRRILLWMVVYVCSHGLPNRAILCEVPVEVVSYAEAKYTRFLVACSRQNVQQPRLRESLKRLVRLGENSSAPRRLRIALIEQGCEQRHEAKRNETYTVVKLAFQCSPCVFGESFRQPASCRHFSS